MAALSAPISLTLILLLMLGGRPVIAVVFGHRYLATFALLQVMTWSLVVSTAAFSLESLLYMVGRQRTALVAQLAAVALYLLLLYRLTHQWGLIGAGYAFLAATVLGSFFLLLPTVQSYRDRRRLPVHAHGRPIAA